MSEKRKVMWLSRHELTQDQITDLARFLNAEIDDLDIESRNVTWQATAVAGDDHARNKAEWVCIFGKLNRGDVVAGVSPPVALEALSALHRQFWWRVVTPVSESVPALRKDPTAPMPFRHLRWSKVL